MHHGIRLALVVACALMGLDAGVAKAQHRYFQIRVVDAETSAPIPCAVARAQTNVEYTTDSQGNIAFYEPALMGVLTWFGVSAPGYEHAADGFGMRGRRVTPIEGETAVFELTQVGTPAPCNAGNGQTERLSGFVPEPNERFGIRMVDAVTGRGVSIVELRWPGGSAVSDNHGWVVIDDPALFDQQVPFEVTVHGYQLAPPNQDGGFVATPVPGGRIGVQLEPLADQIAQRLYRVTGADQYRDTLLLGESAPIEEPLLNALVTGQDSVQMAIYQGELFWLWGDTGWPSYPLGNFRGTAARSQLPGAGGLSPEVGVDLSYFTREDGFARQMAPTSTVPNPPTSGSLAAWMGGLTPVPDAAGQERLLATYALVPGLADPHEEGLLVFDDGAGVFEKALIFDASLPTRPRGASLQWRHDDDAYAYFTNGVRTPARYEAVLDPAQWETFTPVVSGTSGQVERDGQGLPLYRFRNSAPEVTPELADTLGLAAEERLFGHFRQPWTGQRLHRHAGDPVWNAHRGRFVQVFTEIYGSSFLGELWYAEADTPMGPWIYARKVVTHEDYSFYNPRMHPYFDQDGGRTLFFEGTYTTFLTESEPTPRHDYNQVMHRLELDDERLALPVPVYDRSAQGGDFATKAGLRRDDQPGVAPFLAFDRAVQDSVPVYWSGPACGARQLVAGGTPSTPPLFWALPADHASPPPDAIPLYRYRNASSGEEVYSVDPQLAAPGFTRVDTVALVFRNPIAVELPVSDFLGDLVADAGEDQCVAELAPGTGVRVQLDATASSHVSEDIARYTWRYNVDGVEHTASGALPRLTLSPGLYTFELTVEGGDGSVSSDQVLVRIAAAQDEFVMTCDELGYEASWSATPFLGSYAYTLQSFTGPGGSTDPSGIVLHHRPSEGFPDNFYEPDTQVRDGDALGYSVWNGLVPQVSMGFSPPRTVSTLTCPGGECVFSFERGCERTYRGDGTAGRVAVTGDSLIWGPALCGFSPPPEGCAPTLAELLRDGGHREWSKSAPGQGFFSWLDVIREQATAVPDIHVLAFGTNDARAQAGAEPGDEREARAWQTLGSALAGIEAIRAANDSACVVLVSVSEKGMSGGQLDEAYGVEAGRVNDMLEYLAHDAGLPNIQIADWAAQVRAHCPADWLTNPETTCDYFGADQLHMVRAGNEARNALILDAIAACDG